MNESADLDLKEQLARIDQAREEALKFSAEQHKLAAETLKLGAEQNKLGAEQLKMTTEALKLGAEEHKLREEELKLRRDRGLAPWLAVVAISGGVGGIIAGVTAILHLVGKVP